MSVRADNLLSGEHAGQFVTTHWSQVLAARDVSSPYAAAALAQLCQNYWYPLYALVRRQNFSVHEAQDLTQEFFARLLDGHLIAAASQEKGRFRSFLLVALKRFLINEWHRDRAQKRGGGAPLISLDLELAESRYNLEPIDKLTPDLIYERRWAVTLLDQVLDSLRREYEAESKGDLFQAIKVFLCGEKSAHSQAEIGESFGMTEGAVKAAVHRLRVRYRDRLRESVGKTVANPSEIDDELKHLLNVLSS